VGVVNMKNKFGILIAFISISIIILLSIYTNKISDEKVLINGFKKYKYKLLGKS
jgi:hypothetical protein